MQSEASFERPNNLITKEWENSMTEARPVRAFAEITKYELNWQRYR